MMLYIRKEKNKNCVLGIQAGFSSSACTKVLLRCTGTIRSQQAGVGDAVARFQETAAQYTRDYWNTRWKEKRRGKKWKTDSHLTLQRKGFNITAVFKRKDCRNI